jgi:hypothetical protein
VRDIERYRENFLATGAVVGPAAGLLREKGDFAGLHALFGVWSLLILGAWPFGESRDESERP